MCTFPTTCWGRILEAGDPAAPEARAALEGLCRDYWYPLYAFVRRKGHDPETAQDLVQGLFADLLERDDLRGLEPQRGRFRSFLMACCTTTLPGTTNRHGPSSAAAAGSPISIDALHGGVTFRRRALPRLDGRAALRAALGLDPARPRPGRPRCRDGSGRTSGLSTSGCGRRLLGHEAAPPYQVDRRRAGPDRRGREDGRSPAPDALPGATPRRDRPHGR